MAPRQAGKSRCIMIVGASRGLGAAFAAGLGDPGDRLLLVSRTRPERGAEDGIEREWVRADLCHRQTPRALARAIGRGALDALIMNAGVWEQDAFTPRYSFARQSEAATRRIIEVNLTSLILCTGALLPALRRSRNPKVVVIASISALDNANAGEVAYTATNFARRGVVHALRETLRKDRIQVTSLNPGTIASTESPYAAGLDAAIRATHGRLVPMHDLVALLRCVLRLSRATCVKEIDVPALADPAV